MAAQLTLAGTPPPPKVALSQWFTPRQLAESVAKFACIADGDRVLEPSAGTGALATEAGLYTDDVFCVEIDPDLMPGLNALKFPALCGDFLTADLGQFDMALMNPPYEDGQDLAHVLWALKFAPRVVAIVLLGFLAGVERFDKLWSKHTLSRLGLLARRPRFSGSSMTGERDFCVVEILRGKRVIDTSVRWL